jgi:hypothetical protein
MTYGFSNVRWDGFRLRLASGRLLATIEPDAQSGLYRVRMPNGSLSGLANLSRAKDAAVSLALVELNARAA